MASSSLRRAPAPSAEEREAACRTLLARSGQDKVKDIPEAAIDAAIDEATEFIRRHAGALPPHLLDEIREIRAQAP